VAQPASPLVPASVAPASGLQRAVSGTEPKLPDDLVSIEAADVIEMPEIVEPVSATDGDSWDTATLPLPTLGESLAPTEAVGDDDVLHLDLTALEAEATAEAEKASSSTSEAAVQDADLVLPDLDLTLESSSEGVQAVHAESVATTATPDDSVRGTHAATAGDAADATETDEWSSTSLMVPEEMRTPEVDLVLDFDLDLSSFPPMPEETSAAQTGRATTLIAEAEKAVEEVAGDEAVPLDSSSTDEDDGLDLILDDFSDASVGVPPSTTGEAVPASALPSEPSELAVSHAPELSSVVELTESNTSSTVTDAGASGVDLADDAERYKIVGPLRIQIALFNIYLNEADEQSRRLCVELSEWKLELFRPVGENAIALAHSLAGNSATVGFSDLSALARRLEHALERSQARERGEAEEATLYLDVAEEIRRLLHQFAAGFLKPIGAEILERMAQHEANEPALHERMERLTAAEREEEESPATGFAALSPLGEMRFTPLEPVEKAAAAPVQILQPSTTTPVVLGEQIDAADVIDAELFDIFVEEGAELLPQMAEHLREWEARPDQLAPGVAAMRALHTFKGGARLAGAMRLGELAHRLETAIERQTSRGAIDLSMLGQLYQGVDALAEEFQRLKSGGAEPAAAPAPAVEAGASESTELMGGLASSTEVPAGLVEALVQGDDRAEAAEPKLESKVAAAEPAARVDWARIARADTEASAAAGAATFAEFASMGSVRVRAPLLDRMVSHAGEVGIARARMESDVQAMQGSLRELTDNLERLRRQLRDLELQAETQMTTRMEAARSSKQDFDPLEMDRFTRVQELTRMMAESVSDVGTVQRSLTQTLQDAEDQLAMQARLARDLQDDLLRARMMEFDTLSDRLYRVVRQAAKETAKQVRLNLSGGGIEMDRAVLDRIAPPLEHLLRNAVVHGIERPALREVIGKDATGNIEITLRQTGNRRESSRDRASLARCTSY
jgi:chemosensory pili system protein ChpA (sensor histidine kinase/response regulator)